MASDAPVAPPPGPRRGLTKIQKIGLGLVSTLLGIALLAVLFPVAPGSFGYVLPVGAAGIVLLWVGGILMGVGSRS